MATYKIKRHSMNEDIKPKTMDKKILLRNIILWIIGIAIVVIIIANLPPCGCSS